VLAICECIPCDEVYSKIILSNLVVTSRTSTMIILAVVTLFICLVAIIHA